MSDKFNLDGFSVNEFNKVTAEGGIYGGVGKNLILVSDLELQISSLTQLTLSSTTKVIKLPFGLPTSDPVSFGELWSDSGTVKISAG